MEKITVHLNPEGNFLGLKDAEVRWIVDNPERCQTCGHLEIFHINGDSICAVTDCNCPGI